jgi:hypothetical protein
MPSTSPKQKRTMAAAAHDPAFAKKVGIPQDVAEDFFTADQHRAALAKELKRRSKERP